MAVDFPSSPTVGQTFTSGGVVWLWDGVKWTSTGAATGLYLPLAGGAMQGDLILNRDAQVALGAATLEQVQARGSGSNRIINGDMRIDQRNNGASGTAAGYTVDRWSVASTAANKFTWQRLNASSTSIISGLGLPWYLSFISSSAYTAAAGELFNAAQVIEADMVSDFAWGNVNAQPVTLSFWVYSSLTGAFGGSIYNYPTPPTRSYPFTYSIPVANTWTQVVVTIPPDTAGTWVMSGNLAAVGVSFDLGSGANFRAPANAWVNGNYRGATGTVSVVGTNGATFNLTGVKLEIGSIATPFNRKSPQESLADCQRYYHDPAFGAASPTAYQVTCYATAAGAITTAMLFLPVTMRATPTLVVRNQAYANTSAVGVATNSSQTVRSFVTATAAGLATAGFNMTADAEL